MLALVVNIFAFVKKSLHFTVFFSRWSSAEIIEMASEVILAERDF